MHTKYIKNSSRFSKSYFEGCLYWIREMNLYERCSVHKNTPYSLIPFSVDNFNPLIDRRATVQVIQSWWSNAPDALYNYKRTNHCLYQFFSSKYIFCTWQAQIHRIRKHNLEVVDINSWGWHKHCKLTMNIFLPFTAHTNIHDEFGYISITFMWNNF